MRGVDDDDAWASRHLAKTGRRAPCFRVGGRKSLRQRGSRRQVRPHAAPLSGPLRVGLDRTFVVRKHPHGLAIYAVLEPLILTVPAQALRRDGAVRGKWNARSRRGRRRGRYDDVSPTRPYETTSMAMSDTVLTPRFLYHGFVAGSVDTSSSRGRGSSAVAMFWKVGAGEGNRTLVFSLEGYAQA